MTPSSTATHLTVWPSSILAFVSVNTNLPFSFLMIAIDFTSSAAAAGRRDNTRPVADRPATIVKSSNLLRIRSPCEKARWKAACLASSPPAACSPGNIAAALSSPHVSAGSRGYASSEASSRRRPGPTPASTSAPGKIGTSTSKRFAGPRSHTLSKSRKRGSCGDLAWRRLACAGMTTVGRGRAAAAARSTGCCRSAAAAARRRSRPRPAGAAR